MVTVRNSKKGLFSTSAMAMLLIMFLFLVGCGAEGGSADGVTQGDDDVEGTADEGGASEEELAIVVQPGMGYAPLTIIREMGWLEEDLPDVNIEWRTLASGAAIRDGLIAGEIQVGAGGVGPFLLGWDKGVGWKILSSLNNMELWLMAKDPDIRSLEDFEPEDQIAMPGPDSIQSVVLRKGALEQLGDARILDENIVALDHPTAMQALLSDQIAAHLTSPPFQMQEEDEGANIILRSYDLFGDHTFNSVWVHEDYYNDNPEIMDAVFQNVQRAIELIYDDPEQAAEILAEDSDGDPSAEEYKKWLAQDYIEFTSEPNGFINYAEIMQELGMIDNVPSSCEEIVFDTLGNPDDC